MNDKDIRATIKNHLFRRYLNDPGTKIIEELGLNNGSSRIDLAIINGIIHGIEIKSDSDTLSRLPEQIRIYNSILDRITLIVGYKLAGKALKMIPEWWGVKLAEQLPKGNIRIAEARSPRNNPSQDKLAIAKLLWRNEALEFLNEISTNKGIQSKPKKIIYEKLAEVADIDCIKSRVRYQLKMRKDWRVV